MIYNTTDHFVWNIVAVSDTYWDDISDGYPIPG